MGGALHISQAASLGLHAMVLAAGEPQRPLSVGEVAKVLGVSPNHLSKVLQRLVRAKLLRSTRGPRGGFSLRRDPGELTLREVFEAIEGPLEKSTCLLGRPRCKGQCILGDFVARTCAAFDHHLRQTRLSDVAGLFGSKHAVG